MGAYYSLLDVWTNIFIYYYFLYFLFILSVKYSACTMFISGAYGGQKRVSDPLELNYWWL